MSECAKAIKLSAAEIVTVAVRRVNIEDKKKPLLMDYLNPKKIDYDCIPACTYSKPEIGSIGFDQKALDDKGINYKIAKSFFNANGRAVASGSTDGFIKILVSDDNLILGAHIIGSNATEMISEFSLAMSNQLTVENILSSVHPHPTFSEAIFETLMQLK